METVLKMYQLNPAPAENLIRQVETFNQGRTSAEGTYTISMATTYRPYYALWRIFANDHRPLLVRTLAVTLDAALERAFRMLQNCNVMLDLADNALFEANYGQTDDIIAFGKYRGKHLAEIYYVEPSYVLWLANKFTPNNHRYDKLIALAKDFAIVHFELTVQKRHISSVSKFVGKTGEQLKDLYLTVLNVRLQKDSYKADFYVDQNVLAADRDGNRFTFLIKAAGRSLSPNILSCHSRKIEAQETLHLKTARVMSHYEGRGVRYTRLGYVKLL